MKTKNQSIKVALDCPIYSTIKQLSGKCQVSMSTVIQGMVKKQLEKCEDFRLLDIAHIRDKKPEKS